MTVTGRTLSGWILTLVTAVACTPQPATGTRTEVFEGPFDQVTAVTETGRIELVVGDVADVSVEFLPNGTDTYTSSTDGGVLALTAVCIGDEIVGCGGGFILSVPFDQDMIGETGVGELTIGPGYSGVFAGGTASGAISATELGSAALDLLTGTGVVGVGFADLPIDVAIDTGSSAVTLAVPGSSYALDLDTNGEITTDPGLVEDPMGVPLRVHSGTGDIELIAN